MNKFPSNLIFKNLEEINKEYRLSKLREYIYKYLVEIYPQEVKEINKVLENNPNNKEIPNVTGITLLKECSNLTFNPTTEELFVIQNELSNLGWNSHLMYGDTVLFIYHDEKYEPKNQYNHNITILS